MRIDRWIAFAFALVLCGREAAAVEVRDRDRDLRLDVSAPGAIECSVAPVRTQSDECADALSSGPASVLAQLEGVLAVVVLKDAQASLPVVVLGFPVDGVHQTSQEKIPTLMANIERGAQSSARAQSSHYWMRSLDDPSRKYDVTEVGGFPVIAYAGDTSLGVSLNWLIVGKDRVTMVQVVASSETEQRARRIGYGIVTSARGSTAGLDEFGEPDAYFAGKRAGTLGCLFGPLCCGGVTLPVFAFVIHRLTRPRSREKSA